MDATVEDGFFIDPDTNKTFFVNKGMKPHWVKSKPSDWKPIKKNENSNSR